MYKRQLRHCVDLALEWVGYNTVVGRWAEEITVQRIARDAAGALDDPVAVVRACANLARALIETGNQDEADEPIDVMTTHMHRLSDADRARAELNLSWLREQQHHIVKALQHGRNALTIYRSLRRPDKIGLALGYVGWCLALLGEYNESIAMCKEALPILRETGERRFEADLWSTIGYARQRLGDLDAAVAGYEKALRLLGEVHDDYGAAGVWDYLASAQLERGDAEQARASWTRAAELFGALRVARAEQMRAKAESVALPGTRTAHRAGT